MPKIGVVGTGFVGATAAFAIVMRGIGSALARVIEAILDDQP